MPLNRGNVLLENVDNARVSSAGMKMSEAFVSDLRTKCLKPQNVSVAKVNSSSAVSRSCSARHNPVSRTQSCSSERAEDLVLGLCYAASGGQRNKDGRVR